MKVTLPQKQRSIESYIPDLDARTIASVSCNLIEDLLIQPLTKIGRLSPDDLSTIQQIKSVISMLGEKAGAQEGFLEGNFHEDSVN
jgi:hypothetical protein